MLVLAAAAPSRFATADLAPLIGTHGLAGDPRLAVMILAAVIDYNLHQTEARRENIEYVEGLFRLFRQALDTIGSRADRRG